MRTLFRQCLIAAGILAIAAVAYAAPGKATMSFVMPVGVDPMAFYFSHTGDTVRFHGSVLLPAVQDGQGGAEFHGKFGAEFGQFFVTFDYLGDTEIDPSVGPRFTQFTPWADHPDGPFHDLEAQPGSALVGQGDPFFSNLFVSNIDPLDVSAFAASTVIVTAGPNVGVPEPGGLVFASGVAITGLWAVRMRRRVKK